MFRNIIFLDFIGKVLVIVLCLICVCNGERVKKNIDENGKDNGETNEDGNNESLDIQSDVETSNSFRTSNDSVPCPTRRQNSLVHEIKTAKDEEFPFMAAIMSQQNDYLCSGTVVSNGLILTTATCAKKAIGYVLLNATKNIKDGTTAVLHVSNTALFPTYNGHDKDVAVIYTDRFNKSIASQIKISSYNRNSKLSEVEAFGYGLNAAVGQTKELQYIGAQFLPGFSTMENIAIVFDCIETKVVTCFKDIGGPVVVDKELIGIVVKGQDECTSEMTNTYSMNKIIADVLPSYTFKAWLDEIIKKNENQVIEKLNSSKRLNMPTRRIGSANKTRKLSSNQAFIVKSCLLPVFISSIVTCASLF